MPAEPPRSDGDFKSQLVRLHERLNAHMAALAGGRESAIDDIALVARILVAHGVGDDVIKRAVRRFGLEEPLVHVAAPAERYALLDLAFGGLWSPAEEPAHESVQQLWVPIGEWADSLALASPGLRRRFSSWAQVVTDFANSNGAHLSGSTPDVLGHAIFPNIGGRDLGSYMIASAGLVVEHALRNVIESLDLPTPPQDLEPPPITLNRFMLYSATALDQAAVEFQFASREEGEVLWLREGAHSMGPWDLIVSTRKEPGTDPPTWQLGLETRPAATK